MGFNKYYIPEPQQMLSVLENGVSDFFKRKIDSFIGNSTSMQMIDDAWGFLNMNMEQTEIIQALKEKYQHEFRNTSDPV
jgi:hypothetical protein